MHKLSLLIDELGSSTEAGAVPGRSHAFLGHHSEISLNKWRKTAWSYRPSDVRQHRGETPFQTRGNFPTYSSAQVVGKRAGDSTAVWADTTMAEKELGWKAKYNVQDMCTHQWQWATKFPKGYETA